MINILEVWETKYRQLMQCYYNSMEEKYIKKAVLCLQAKNNVYWHKRDLTKNKG